MPVTQLATRIAEKVGPQRYNVWFRNATQFAFMDDYLRVSAPNHFIGEWIERHFADVIAETAREVTGHDFTLNFTIDPELAKGLGKKQPDRQVDFVANNPERLARQQKRSGRPVAQRSLRGRLDEFVVGPCNQLAFAAATAVIDQPAGTYKPAVRARRVWRGQDAPDPGDL